MRLNHFASSLLALCLPIAFTSNEGVSQSVTDIVATSGLEFDDDNHNFNILFNAVAAAGLGDALAAADLNATVFAPIDLAFIRLAQDLGFHGSDEEGAWLYLVDQLTTIGGGDPIPVLTDVLLYHVAPGNYTRSRIFFSTFFRRTIPTLLDGATIRPFFFWLVDNDPDLRNPRLIRPRNLRASNGLIQGINRVLIPLDL